VRNKCPPNPLNSMIFVTPALGLHKQSIHLYDSDEDCRSYIWLEDGVDAYSQLD